MIKKIKETFIKFLAKLVQQGAKEILEQKKGEIPNVDSYKFMIEQLKNHYKQESIRTGQIDEGHMESKLANMSFDQVKELFDSILQIKLSYQYEYIPEKKEINTQEKSTENQTDNKGE